MMVPEQNGFYIKSVGNEWCTYYYCLLDVKVVEYYIHGLVKQINTF